MRLCPSVALTTFAWGCALAPRPFSQQFKENRGRSPTQKWSSTEGQSHILTTGGEADAIKFLRRPEAAFFTSPSRRIFSTDFPLAENRKRVYTAAMFNDLSYAFRTLRKSPIFTLTVVVTIALAIGASTAIFSVTSGVLLRQLPYKDSERLVLTCNDMQRRNVKDFPLSNADFLDLRNGARNN